MNMEIKMRSIVEKYGRDVMMVAILVLVSISSFALGRISVAPAPDKVRLLEANLIHTTHARAELPISDLKAGGEVVASKRGAMYYLPFCKAALRISDANKIYFESEEKARAAGYTPAQNCAGMK